MSGHFIRILILGAVAMLGGCGGGSSAGSGPEPDPGPVGLLRKVSGPDELEASIKAGLTTIQTSQRFDSTAGNGAGAPVETSYSRTYTQDADVDEFDSVKYDGDYLFVAPLRSQFGCCFVDTALAAAPPPVERSIRIFETRPADAAAEEVARIALEDNVSVQGLYRVDDRLIAMTSEAWYGSYGGPWASFAIWAPETSGISVYDTSDIRDPQLAFEATFDGILIDSRRVGDTVYVISRYTPQVDNLEYFVTTAAAQASNQAILNDVSLDELLPGITVNGLRRSLVDPAECYVPSDSPPSYPVITSITAIPVADPEAFATTCYNDDAYGSYVSSQALYLAQSKADGEKTRVHKFALQDALPAYRGSADINGIVWTGGQADFRLSEKGGDLRAFASSFSQDSTDFVDHHLYVLRESSSGVALELVAELPNADRPAEIGKPNEVLYGVRFVGDRAYAVTFERIDPLYVIDLADPADPRIAGTLEISGFSDLLHPVTDELLLGLGTSDNNAVKLELFDVSNIAQPLSIGSDVLGGPFSHSEAIYDRHAFTYLADVGGVDRFTIPADLTANDGSGQLLESGLYLYEIRDKAMPNLASLNAVGRVVVRDADSGSAPGFSIRSRAVLHDEALYYLRDDELYSVFWSTPGNLNGPH